MGLAEVVVSGLMLGGMYALIALGFNLQYGVARILNLAYGEFFMTACFAAFWMFTLWQINPLVGLVLSAPVTFAANWLIYRFLMLPLVRRSRSRAQLEAETILSTFGLLFLIQGGATSAFSGNLRSYEFLSYPMPVFGFTFAANRLLAFALAVIVGGGIYLLLRFTRAGMAVRALADDPAAAGLVAIPTERLSALAFAAGGALVCVAGTLISTFLTFDPTIGVTFTMKALVVVIMGGVGNMLGGLAAGFLLGLAEALCSYLVDPGLTLAVAFALFLVVLLIRPRGLFGSP
jgi:branched-chain amino acid transport system permease protein